MLLRRSLRAAAARLPAAAASSSAAPVRALSSKGSSYVDLSETGEAKRRKKQSNFWRQWGERSQQEFWQEVGFGHDRAKDEARSGIKTTRDARGRVKGVKGIRPASHKLEAPESVDDTSKYEEDEYWDAIDGMDPYGEGVEALGEGVDRTEEHYWGASDASTRAEAARADRAKAAMLRDDEIAPSRRAELMMLLEDMGPEGLLPPAPMPDEPWLKAKQEGTFKLGEDLNRNLVTTRS